METLQATKPVNIGDVTLVPIERSGFHSNTDDAGCWICAHKEIYAIVVCDANGIRALDTDSAEIELDTLIQQTPNLDSLLSRVSGT